MPKHCFCLSFSTIAVLTGILFTYGGVPPGYAGSSNEFRVCADPNNLPFSDQNGTGFENRIADLVAEELGERVAYTWWAQRRGFVRNTLKAELCDAVIGVPAHYDPVLPTRPYYRSSYVFVSRTDRNLGISSLRDPRLRNLRIGIHLIGDDGMNTPPAHALGEQGIVDNVVGYSIYGDYRQRAPPARLIEAVARGEIDLAVAWGPLAGFAAKHSQIPLDIALIADGESFPALQFQFDIAMGVRRGDRALKDKLDDILTRRHAAIRSILEQHGVPLLGSISAQ